MKRNSRINPVQIKNEDDSDNQNNPQPIAPHPAEPVPQSFASYLADEIERELVRTRRDRERQYEEEAIANRVKEVERGLLMLDIMQEQFSSGSAFVPYQRTFPTESSSDPRADGDQAAATLPLAQAKPVSPSTKAADHEVLKINNAFKTIHDATGKEVNAGSKDGKTRGEAAEDIKGGKTGGEADEGVKGSTTSSSLPPNIAAEGKNASVVSEDAHGGNAGDANSGNKDERSNDASEENGGSKSKGSGSNTAGESSSSESRETDSSGSERTNAGSKDGKTGGEADEGINNGIPPSSLPSGTAAEGKNASGVSEDAHGENAGDGNSENKGERSSDASGENGGCKNEGSGNIIIGESSSSEIRGTDSNEENVGDITSNRGGSGDSSGGGKTSTIFKSTGPGVPDITVTPPTPPPNRKQRRPTIHPPFKREVDPRCQLPQKSPKKN